MIFYRRIQDKKLHSFGESVLDAPILGIPLRQQQEMAIRSVNCLLKDIQNESEITDAAYYIFDEDLFFSAEFIQEVMTFKGSKDSLRFILAPNTFNERYILPHDMNESEYLKFNFYLRHQNQKECKEQIVSQKIFGQPIPVPDQIVKGGLYYMDQCAVFIGRIASPFHLLQLNLAANFKRVVKYQGKTPNWIKNLFPPFSGRYYRFLKRTNKIGKRCRIHPSAIIEGSIIGDDVVIGANAIIRLSKVGDGCQINDRVSIIYSVIGKRNTIANANHLLLCMTYDDVFSIHGPYQFSIFGKSSAAFAVINCDIRLDQKNIKIPTDVGVLDSKQPLLGIAYGHYSKVGGGNIIAAGRIVPNHKHILPPDIIITDTETNG